MIEAIKNMFGFERTDYSKLLKDGAVIIDVRSKSEYAGGHIKGSVNITLDSLQNNLNKFKDKNKAIITCCASGMRSASAKSILKANGYSNVHNGGGWQSLNNKLK